MNDDAVSRVSSAGDWHGPGARSRARRAFSWRELVWALVLPARQHRIGVTVPGGFLIALSFGIGTAAYNAASNILFLTLALLLACLLLSGLLSWFNFMGVCWRVRPPAAWRAGHETLVTLEVRNTKSWLPTYGLWFDFAAHPAAKDSDSAPDLAPQSVRAVLAAAEKAVTRGRVFVRARLEPRGELPVEWDFWPERRGEHVLSLEAVGSLFPFGFLRKSVGSAQRQTVLVWPAQVDYHWRGALAAAGGGAGRRTVRAGLGEDLLALRKYASGDSHRLVHWKATARLGQLMVRQFAAESLDGFELCVETPATVWTRPEQFERLCSFAATLAEDLFAAGRLRAASVNGVRVETRRVREVETVLDLLAVAEPGSSAVSGGPGTLARRGIGDESGNERGEGTPPTGRRDMLNLITFAPEGAHSVTAYVDGVPTASA